MEKSFAEKLKSLRKYKRITQEKLAEMVELDVRHIARLEAGEGLPTVTTLLKFCSAFDVTPNELITGIITEKGILKPDFKTSISNAFKS